MVAKPGTAVFAPHVPVMGSGGHTHAQTNTDGTAFVAFPDVAARQVTIANNTGTTIELQQDGAGDTFPVFSGVYFTFYGLFNASQLSVRRVDVSNTQVTVNARWEA